MGWRLMANGYQPGDKRSNKRFRVEHVCTQKGERPSTDEAHPFHPINSLYSSFSRLASSAFIPPYWWARAVPGGRRNLQVPADLSLLLAR